MIFFSSSAAFVYSISLPSKLGSFFFFFVLDMGGKGYLGEDFHAAFRHLANHKQGFKLEPHC